MAIPQNELPNHDRFGVLPRVEPRMRTLGRCACPCGEPVHAGYEYIRWDDKLFLDRVCVINYLKRYDDLEEVS